MQDFKKNLTMLGKRITELRQQNNISMLELSLKSKISVSYLKKIESGNATGINTKHLYRLYKNLNVKSFKEFLNFY